MSTNQTGDVKECLSACRRALATVGFTSFFINLLMLTVPLYMLQLFDRVLSSRSEDTLVHLTIAAVGALAVLGVLDMMRARILVRMSTWIESRLGPKAVERSISASLIGSDYGDQSLRDLSQFRQYVGSPAIFSLFDVPWVPVFLAIIYLLHPILGTIGFGGAVLLFGIAVVNELSTRKLLREANASWVKATRGTAAAVRNADVIEAMGLMPGVIRSWLSDNAVSLKLQQVASDRAGFFLSGAKTIRLFLQIAMFATGAMLVLRNEISPGVMFAGALILARALSPVEQAISGWKVFVGARAAYNRLNRFLQKAPVRNVELKLPVPHGRLSVEQITVVPPGAKKPVLKRVSFELEAGKVLAVVGPTAAGKSTLARTIVGSWKPQSGQVRLDGADVYTWERSDFARHVGYLPQDVELFAGTVAYNIGRLNEASNEDVVAAAQAVGVHEMILGLEDGYQTEIGDGGVMLSGGQRQCIGLARAFFGNPKLLVLDEPNANLDSEGEAALIRALKAAKERGTTIVLIVHKPSLTSCADNILILKEGVVSRYGARAELMARLTQPVAQLSVVDSASGKQS